MSFNPLYSAEQVQLGRSSPIQVFNKFPDWRKYTGQIATLAASFAQVAALPKYDNAKIFSRAANHFVRQPKQDLQIATVSIEFPYFDEKYQRSHYPVADLFLVGSRLEIGEDKIGQVKADLMKEAGPTFLMPNGAVKMGDASRYSPEYVRPAFNSNEFFIGDLVVDKINFPHRGEHLRRTSCVPIAAYSPDNFTFVTPEHATAEKILQVLQQFQPK